VTADPAPPPLPSLPQGQVVFTVNGPGEISAWLWPVSHALRRIAPWLRLHACLLPCVFSSGAEAAVAERLGTLDGVSAVAESMALVRRGRRPTGLGVGRTLVVHLGGEVMLTRILGWRLSAPLWAYAEAPFAGMRAFERVWFSGLNPLPRHLEDPGRLIGDLMVDAAALRRAQAPPRSTGTGPLLGLFPGSRDYAVRPLLPYYAWFVDRLAERIPSLAAAVARADFVPEAVLAAIPAPPPDAPWPHSGLRLVGGGGERWLLTAGGRRIEVLTNAAVLARADAALTIPGTNTGEIAAAGIPMAVVAPLYLSEQVPLPGLAGHLGRVPGLGPALKRALLRRQLARMPFLALPNRRAGRMIVPEFVGTDLHAGLLAALERLLAGDTAAMRADLRAAMGPPGAAARLAAAIAAHFDPAALPAGPAEVEV
jgi:lipid-A-disaccharide synthase